SGVDQEGAELRMVLQRTQDRRHLHEVGPRPDDAVDLAHVPVHPKARAESASPAEASERKTFRPKCPARAPAAVPARKLSRTLARNPATAAVQIAPAVPSSPAARPPSATASDASAAALNPARLMPPGVPCGIDTSLPPRSPSAGPPITGPSSVAAVSAKAPASDAT